MNSGEHYPYRRGEPRTQKDFLDAFNKRGVFGLEHQPDPDEITTVLKDQYPQLRRKFLSLSTTTDPKLPLLFGLQRANLRAVTRIDPSPMSLTCHGVKDLHCDQLLDQAVQAQEDHSDAAYGFYTDVAWTIYMMLGLIPAAETFRQYGVEREVSHAVRFMRPHFGQVVDPVEMKAQLSAEYESVLRLMRQDPTKTGILVLEEARSRLLKRPTRINRYDEADLPGSTPEFIDAGTKLTMDLYRAYYPAAHSLYSSDN